MRTIWLSIFTLAVMMLSVPSVAMASESNIEQRDLELTSITLGYSNGMMHITGANGLVVRVYNVAGIAVKTFKLDGNDKKINLPLADGVYIVKVGNSFSRKICVKH